MEIHKEEKNVLRTLTSENFKKAIFSLSPVKNQVERLTAIAVSQVKQNPKLLTCDPTSVCVSISKALELGLSLGHGGEAYLIPFWSTAKRTNECSIIIGYKGILSLMYKTGLVKMIDTGTVRALDEFDFWKDEKIHFYHKPNFKEKKAPIERFYARLEMRNGGFNVALVDIEEAEFLKDKADEKAKKAGLKENSFWNEFFEEMGKKTAIRRLAKNVPNFNFIDKILKEEDELFYNNGTEKPIINVSPASKAEDIIRKITDGGGNE